MRSRQSRTTAGRRLDGLRPERAGVAEPGPDPRFRALLRERLVTAAGRDGERAGARASDTDRNEARDDGRNARVD
ncbi:hypothetical protein [Actinomadura violacea]|uniref:Uncharacterized protein n=1 Tax=Actinomadura violacea TaxID=2819934 RepID=A0ABS3RWQ9_9ACTN|nr:hypothetical protein [Actinomadura violacea]MBO2460450.1 hypothetical protein [Actinomadura violacea]